MALGLWVFLGWMIFVAVIAIGLLIWAWRTGQFKNIEEAKYRMLEDREPEPWPAKNEKKDQDEGGDRT
jgi:nitrogen fixation-related uncharacterized protein